MSSNNTSIPVALAHCHTYAGQEFDSTLGQVLDQGCQRPAPGTRILVKPNLVAARPLACTSPAVVAGVCAWLLDHGAKVTVADSPGIGRGQSVARAIGLDAALSPLGLTVNDLDDPVLTRLSLPESADKTNVTVGLSRQALESDLIFSLPRLKAHRFTMLTLAVKNCFGCVPGMRKALLHYSHGRETAFFADCLAAIWAALPPVAALIDGIEAMHVTGPISGKPVQTGLLGASQSAVALDEAIVEAFAQSHPALPGKTEAGIFYPDPHTLPMSAALRRRGATCQGNNGPNKTWPLCQPQDFDLSAFALPDELDSCWFHPLRILKSLHKRIMGWWR